MVHKLLKENLNYQSKWKQKYLTIQSIPMVIIHSLYRNNSDIAIMLTTIIIILLAYAKYIEHFILVFALFSNNKM